MHLGACYYPEHWPRERWETDARLMRAAGFTAVRVGEFAWALLEPAPGQLELAWLVQAVEVLAAAGLAVILGTPTAAPPPWLTHRYPQVLPVGPDGRVRQPGSRRHYCVNHPLYQELAAGITRALADGLGGHPAVVGWQLDNELGCHDTARCCCEGCARRFRAWLQARYGSLEALNEAWGTVFWSQRYAAWDEILPPEGLVYEANPGHWLDWCRAASSGNAAFLAAQAAIVRERSPGRFITHNLMGGFDDLDHAELVGCLDRVGWDNYAPPGWGPQAQAMAHDRMYGLLQRPFWVLEQQCGPTNWAGENPMPAPGQVRLWTYQALAHGAEGLLYFRWRAGLVGTEQLHGGLLPHDGEPGRIYAEVAATAHELASLPALAPPAPHVALLYDEPSRWALRHQPHHQALREAGPDAYDLPYYEALRGLGLDVAVVPAGADLAGYALVVAASQYLVDDALLERLTAYASAGGRLLVGARTGFKDDHSRVRPRGLRALTGARVTELDAGPVGLELADGTHVLVETLFERLEPAADAVVMGRYADGAPAVTRRPAGAGEVWYVGAVGAKEVLRLLYPGRAPLPAGLELARRGELTFALNHGAHAVDLPAPGQDLLTGQRVGRLPPLGVAVLAAWGR